MQLSPEKLKEALHFCILAHECDLDCNDCPYCDIRGKFCPSTRDSLEYILQLEIEILKLKLKITKLEGVTK